LQGFLFFWPMNSPLVIRYPESLPVSQRKDEIAELIRNHPVVIVAGETGSGKTTQLPKICLELGRGRAGIIGHTQPRRVAASSVAARIAEELEVPLGKEVGFQVRFTDTSSKETLLKLMTDGVLLAEIVRDPGALPVPETEERALQGCDPVGPALIAASTGTWSAVKNTQRADSTQLGLAGYTITTRDPDTRLDICFRGSYEGHPFTRATVLHGADSSFRVSAWCADTGVIILWNTDVTLGRTTIGFSRAIDTLHLRFEQVDTLAERSFTLRGIILGGEEPGIIYHALGVNGASTRSWLACPRLEEDLSLVTPDLVVFSIGINDAHDPNFSAERYERNYDALIGKVRKVNPDAAVLLVTNSDSYRKRRYPVRNAEAVRRTMLRLGKARMRRVGPVRRDGRAGLHTPLEATRAGASRPGPFHT